MISVSKIHPSKGRGFALIVTVSLMVLLTLIAVGLLSLSAVSLHSSSQTMAQSEACANARLALMIAIGELQKQLGPDQRISASGAIISESQVRHPHWTGVWNSWQAGRPDPANSTSDPESEHRTIIDSSANGMAPTYVSQRRDHFRAWLLSLAPGEAEKIDSARDLNFDGIVMPSANTDAVQLVGKGSLGKGAPAMDYVSARLLRLQSKTVTSQGGRYAWWVGDESQKASVQADPYSRSGNLTAADLISRCQAPGSMGNSIAEGLAGITDEKQLDRLASFRSLDLVDVQPVRAATDDKPSQLNFHSAAVFNFGVLADVREGGLKRDLSALLEREIKPTENGDEFMLYRLKAGDQARVPIQDLSAYYQLYYNDDNWSRGRRSGIKYDSGPLKSAIQVSSPDYDGGNKNRRKYLREYTSLYRSPIPIKVQFLLAVAAKRITDDDRNWFNDTLRPGINANCPRLRPEDTHRLLLGLLPVITLWNPNNVPLVMERPQVFKMNPPAFSLNWRKISGGGGVFNDSHYLNLAYAMRHSVQNEYATGEITTGTETFDGWLHVIKMRFAKTAPVVFEPGEVKLFSLPAQNGMGLLDNTGKMYDFWEIHDGDNKWDPYALLLAQNSAATSDWRNQRPDVITFRIPGDGWRKSNNLVFNGSDRIDFRVFAEPATVSVSNNEKGRVIGGYNEIYGSGLHFYMLDEDYEPVAAGSDFLRHHQLLSRFGARKSTNELGAFNRGLMKLASNNSTAGDVIIDFDGEGISGDDIIGASIAVPPQAKGILEFSLTAACEMRDQAVGGNGGGRRITTRPFLNGHLITPPFMDNYENKDIYNYGWDWQLNRLNDIEESIVGGEPGTGHGYFGGGYTSEAGATHVVQQDLPVMPPVSIAALSHAHLGGFSLAESAMLGAAPYTDQYNWMKEAFRDPKDKDAFRRATATGQGGLAPHVLQAIGNSYAHPNIPADKAFTTRKRTLDIEVGPVEEPFADHSYLANKALWDEFFFSSITPHSSTVKLPGFNRDKTAAEVADEFFFGNGTLPNRRFVPYTHRLSKDALRGLTDQYDVFSGGFSDKVASHLLVSAPFNINSTSEEAWKVLFASLRNRAVGYLEHGKSSPTETSIGNDVTPVGPGALPNGKPVAGNVLNGDPNDPAAQWNSWRGLSDEEITALARAIVKQVKLRGPFLSLSEFVNRRLDGGNPELAVKGALQAAIDDDKVDINKAFRDPGRMLDSETSDIDFAFKKAAEGPVAYGSAAYVDQADLLRGMASILTPRGDTFVIRTYGDSLDAKGDVAARAWCEAVVQRVPDYIDMADSSYLKQSDLVSATNRKLGRHFQLVNFRWLNTDEI